MKQVYLLSGLGADRRVFDFLNLSGFTSHHVEWIKPIAGESMSSYASRLLPQIQTANPILLGVSFGGAVATEIGKLISVEKIVLISSAKTKYDLPWISRVLGHAGIHHLLPFQKVNQSARVSAHLFGARSSDEKALLKAILQDTDIDFLRWGLGQLMRWNNKVAHPKATLIHGDNDLVLPHRHADYLIKGGGHFMIVNRATKIGGLVRKLIEG